MEKTFVYMVSDEDYSSIFALEAEEPFISNLKDGKTFRYIKNESELSVYVKKFPNVKFMYQTEVEQKKAQNRQNFQNKQAQKNSSTNSQVAIQQERAIAAKQKQATTNSQHYININIGNQKTAQVVVNTNTNINATTGGR